MAVVLLQHHSADWAEGFNRGDFRFESCTGPSVIAGGYVRIRSGSLWGAGEIDLWLNRDIMLRSACGCNAETFATTRVSNVATGEFHSAILLHRLFRPTDG